MSTRLAGVDLAWQCERNGTAIAFGELDGRVLRVDEVIDDVASRDEVTDRLLADERVGGISIDAPLIINNDSGQRACERLIGRAYSARKAACHTSNRAQYPDAASVAIAEHLSDRGFAHAGSRGGKWQLECYPHPAIIEIFGLPERHAYKKGRVADRREGQAALGGMLARLGHSDVLSLQLTADLEDRCSGHYIHDLRGCALKRNEDAIDAVICLYIAGLYAVGVDDRVFGDTRDGYIYVPQRQCV